jgi:hypothetical protein
MIRVLRPAKLSAPSQAWLRHELSSVVIAAYGCSLIVLGFLLSSERFAHWFVLPVWLCGVVIATDAVEWLRGRINLFDPLGIVGLLGVHFFFLAPLLHVSWDIWMLYVEPPKDWRGWLGGMALLNVIGLLLYRVARAWVLRVRVRERRRASWHIQPRVFYSLALFMILVAFVLQMRVYMSFGGLSSYIEAATSLDYADSRVDNTGAMRGMGFIFIFSESLPIVAMMLFAVYARGRPGRLQSWPVLCLVLVAYFVVSMLFGGLRGSRSTTIWALFWAVGIIHLWIRPMPRKLIYLGLIWLVLFMYVYGIFKEGGVEGLQARFLGVETSVDYEQAHQKRGLRQMLLGDLGRSDVHALLLQRMVHPRSDYQYAWGRTYVAAGLTLVPRQLIERPPTKELEGTDALFGRGSFATGEWVASNVYGLTGEAMLNFGPLLAPFSFIVLGLSVGLVKRGLLALEPWDARLLLMPFLINLTLMWLSSDFNNMIFNAIKGGAIPLMLIFLGTRRSCEGGRA